MHKNTSPSRRLNPWAAAVAAGLLAASGAVFAGEALPDELPSMRTPVEAPVSGITRADVKAELAEARLAGTLAGGGDASDTPQLLAARDRYNAVQTEMLMAQAEAEALARDQALVDEVDELLAEMTAYEVLVPVEIAVIAVDDDSTEAQP